MAGVRSDYTLEIRYGEIVPKKSLQFFVLRPLHCSKSGGVLSLGNRP
ncbi:MAG TPA: hypothetical protein VMT71_05900 [Syntrophorhabdales bacterium]|nr:hypothetical protein [Syntrophorhabdales bacterium]